MKHQRRQILMQDQTIKTNNQTTIKHQSGTRKVKYSQTKANRGLSRSCPFHIILNRKVEPVNRGYAEQAFSNQ